LIQLRGLDSRVRPQAELAHELARGVGIDPTVTSTYRSWEEQTRLRATYERGESRFPANRPGDSAHNYGWAWDSVVPEHQQAEWNQIRESVGFRVPPNDLIHAELPEWRQYLGLGFQEVGVVPPTVSRLSLRYPGTPGSPQIDPSAERSLALGAGVPSRVCPSLPR